MVVEFESQKEEEGMATIDLIAPMTKGLPKHFPYEKTRPLQTAAIEKISEAWVRGYKYVILEAPTGFGKSAVAITLAKQNPPSYILVSTKVLQNQYVREGAFKTVQIRGRSNFRCMLSGKGSCNSGPCILNRQCEHKPLRGSEKVPSNYIKTAETANDELYSNAEAPLCHYWEQKCDALNHKYPVMNYSYFLAETSYAQDFGRRKLMVCDEAHNMEDELLRFISFSLSDEHLRHIHCQIPQGDTPTGKWIEYLNEWATNMAVEEESSREIALETKDDYRKSESMEKMQDLAENIEKCRFIAKELSSDPDNWSIDLAEKEDGRKVTFKPLFVRRYGKRFSAMADRFLLQSATIIDAVSLADSLGFPREECIFIRAGSDFDPKKRPFYYKPVGSMSFKDKRETLPKLADHIRKLIAAHPDQKGVIHTHTYDIQSYLMDSISSPRFIANARDDPQKREDVIREFIRSDLPLILVTPSAHEGMDFKDDICRWQVICKIPYPDLNDRQVKMRMEIDRRWYLWKTILRLVQTYGRGTRSDTDWCDTFLFDSSFSGLWRQCKNIMPVWFREAIVQIETLDEIIPKNVNKAPQMISEGGYIRCTYCNRPFLSESDAKGHEDICARKPREQE